jgi:hypothetical protein
MTTTKQALDAVKAKAEKMLGHIKAAKAGGNTPFAVQDAIEKAQNEFNSIDTDALAAQVQSAPPPPAETEDVPDEDKGKKTPTKK